MDQTTTFTGYDRRRAVERLSAFIAQSVDAARAVEKPFFHLEFDRVFPDDIYAQMLALMPEAPDYRPMHGRSKGHDLDDGTHTRVKIDLFPEYIRNLPPEKRALWDVVGRALCSEPVKQAFIRRLAPGLSKRFGADFAKVGMYPIPILTRDIPGYLITPHTDTQAGRASPSSSICRRTTPTPTSAPSSTSGCPTARCRSRRRCALRPTPAMPSRSAPTPGTRPTRCTTGVKTRDFDPADLFRRPGPAEGAAQPRQAARQFRAQRDPRRSRCRSEPAATAH